MLLFGKTRTIAPERLQGAHIFPTRFTEPLCYKPEEFLTIQVPSAWNLPVDNALFTNEFWFNGGDFNFLNIGPDPTLEDGAISTNLGNKFKNAFAKIESLFNVEKNSKSIAFEPMSLIQVNRVKMKYLEAASLYCDNTMFVGNFYTKIANTNSTKLGELVPEQVLLHSAIDKLPDWFEASVTSFLIDAFRNYQFESLTTLEAAINEKTALFPGLYKKDSYLRRRLISQKQKINPFLLFFNLLVVFGQFWRVV